MISIKKKAVNLKDDFQAYAFSRYLKQNGIDTILFSKYPSTVLFMYHADQKNGVKRLFKKVGVKWNMAVDFVPVEYNEVNFL